MRTRRSFHPIVLIMVLTLLARWIPGPRTIDDAYITFRYARNLLAGNGLVYNPGETVLGTTTPVYALLLAAIGAFTGGSQAPFPALAVAVNALFDALTGWLLYRLGDRLGSPRAGMASALIWAVSPWSVTFAIGGMETSLLVALATATFYFYSTQRPFPCAISGSLALLTRPDSLLFLTPLGLDRFRRTLRNTRLNPSPLPIKPSEGLAFGLPIGAWVVIGSLYYGNPIPHSILAKVAAYHLPPTAGLVRLLQHYATPFLGHLIFGTRVWVLFGLLVYPALYGLGALMGIRKDFSTWAIWVYPWLYLAAFAVANPLIFRWYLTPPLPMYFLGIFLGVERIARDVGTPTVMVGAAGMAFLLTLNGWTLMPDHGPQRPSPEMAFIRLELLYEAIGKGLEGQIRPSEVLAAGDIGALGYFTDARILDTIGLISPQSVRYYPLPEDAYEPGQNYAVPSALITDLKPDLVVILEIYGRGTLLKDPTFLEAYSLEMRVPTDLYGSNDMLIFRLRRPPPIESGPDQSENEIPALETGINA